ncbi:MAG: tetratricopeptide repeat protein [Pyrinomonadaceae bacterium]|nr:tetratricopeptide repeat protein [Pyrinomonadaceae bacterium]
MNLKIFISSAILIVLFSQLAFTQTQKPSPEMVAANKLVKEKKWKEAESAFRAIVKTEPKNARAWYFLGFARHSQENWPGAIEAFKKNVELAKTAAGMYNVAAGYSRLNKKAEAFEWLEKALNNGAAFGTNIEKDTDFENIRSDARFAKMREIVKRKRNPCMYSKEARQFDFWLGDWDVYVGSNTVGENLIELDTQGCTLVENWKNNGGGKGKSLNVYDPSVKKWKQFYVGGQGGVFLFEGEYRAKEKSMYFTAETLGRNGTKIMHIFEFFDLPDKTVQQRWKQSTDGGKTWNTVWDSIYKKKKNH